MHSAPETHWKPPSQGWPSAFLGTQVPWSSGTHRRLAWQLELPLGAEQGAPRPSPSSWQCPATQALCQPQISAPPQLSPFFFLTEQTPHSSAPYSVEYGPAQMPDEHCRRSSHGAPCGREPAATGNSSISP